MILNQSYMEIKILGTSCSKCKELEKITREIVAENNINATVIKIDDIMDIMKYGVLSFPALVINDKIEVKGRVPSANEIKEILSTYY